MRSSDQAFDVMSIIGQRGLLSVLKEEHQAVPVLIKHSASNTSSGMQRNPLSSCSFRQRAGLAVYICVFLNACPVTGKHQGYNVMNGLDAWYTLVCKVVCGNPCLHIMLCEGESQMHKLCYTQQCTSTVYIHSLAGLGLICMIAKDCVPDCSACASTLCRCLSMADACCYSP